VRDELEIGKVAPFAEDSRRTTQTLARKGDYEAKVLGKKRISKKKEGGKVRSFRALYRRIHVI